MFLKVQQINLKSAVSSVSFAVKISDSQNAIGKETAPEIKIVLVFLMNRKISNIQTQPHEFGCSGVPGAKLFVAYLFNAMILYKLIIFT